jgi:ABC-type transport system involved in multi-copper enzyme maturation permease subunit
MLEIFRLQLRQILGGRRKWLVLLLLVVPVALTFVSMEFGGLGQVYRSTGGRKGGGPADRPAGSPGAGFRRIDSARELEELLTRARRDGITIPSLALAGSRAIYQGRAAHLRQRIVINRGWIVITKGRIWVNDARRPPPGKGLRVHIHWQGRSMPPLAWHWLSSIYLYMFFPQVLCLLLALLYGTSLLGRELEGKTLTYLFTRPVARWKVVAGKYLAIQAAVLPPTLLSLAVTWYLLRQPGSPGLLGAMAVAAGGATVAYNALFVLLGFLFPRRALVLALVYGVFEFLVSLIPALINTITVTYYLRSLVRRLGPYTDVEKLEPELQRMVGGASLETAAAVVGGITLVALLAAAIMASRREYVVTEQA